MQVPSEWVADYGRLVVLGGRIEFAAYAIAATLGVQRPSSGRTDAFSRTCTSICRALKEPLPVIVQIAGDDWADRAESWASRAPRIMDDHRNYHFHTLTLMQSDGEAWHPARVERHDDFETVRPLDREELHQAIRELRVLDREGVDLWSVAPPPFLVAHQVREHVDLSALYRPAEGGDLPDALQSFFQSATTPAPPV